MLRSLEPATGQQGVSITAEALAWCALIGAAGLLRLADLDGLPLTVDESARAFEAEQVARGDVPPTWNGDFTAAASSYLFRIFGESEFLGRLIPALAGFVTVALLWLARPYAGRVGALAAGVLVAFSPLFVIASRSAREFSTGSLLALVMTVSLFTYLDRPRLGSAFVLIVALAMAALTDAVAVVAAIAALAFMLLEGLVFASRDVREAWRAFLSNPLHWVIALMISAAAVQLGTTHFGTSLDGIDLPGLGMFWDMFRPAEDGRGAGYFPLLLLAYDWPILFGGAAGAIFLVARSIRAHAGLAPLDRFLLVWTALAVFTLVLVSRRESGQLLMLLLPLSLLAGRLAEAVARRREWAPVIRWWPLAAFTLAGAGTTALLMTEWSSGAAGATERLLLLATVAVSACTLATLLLFGRAGALAAAGVVVLLAAVFTMHSSLAVAFTNGSELTVEMRTLPRAEQLRDTLERLAGERDGQIAVDADLVEELGWTLRNSPVTFGGPMEEAAVVLSRPDAAPPGFAGREEVWRVAEGWYPDDILAPRRMWRWLLYRRPYGDVEAVEVRIFVRTI